MHRANNCSDSLFRPTRRFRQTARPENSSLVEHGKMRIDSLVPNVRSDSGNNHDFRTEFHERTFQVRLEIKFRKKCSVFEASTFGSGFQASMQDIEKVLNMSNLCKNEFTLTYTKVSLAAYVWLI